MLIQRLKIGDNIYLLGVLVGDLISVICWTPLQNSSKLIFPFPSGSNNWTIPIISWNETNDKISWTYTIEQTFFVWHYNLYTFNLRILSTLHLHQPLSLHQAPVSTFVGSLSHCFNLCLSTQSLCQPLPVHTAPA